MIHTNPKCRYLSRSQRFFHCKNWIVLFFLDAGQVVMTNTNVSQEKLTSTKCEEDELEVIENGGLSPHPSLRTEDDACSEIIRIEQGGSQDRDPEQHTTLERIVRTLQVRGHWAGTPRDDVL